MVVLPTTNVEVDKYLRPVHRSAFERLQRIDGEGWLQAAIWHFATGRGRATERHRTVFAYDINVFPKAREATRALKDVRLKLRHVRIEHHGCRIFSRGTARHTLVFLFFALGTEEVESYYEYQGVAPRGLAARLRGIFNRQSRQLIRRTAQFDQLRRQPLPTAAPTTRRDTATPISIPSLTPPATVLATIAAPSSTATSTSMPVPSAVVSPSPTASATPTRTPPSLVATASMSAASYHPGDVAELTVTVEAYGQPLPDARISAQFAFPGGVQSRTAVSDGSGSASCGVVVPSIADGTSVSVTVQVTSIAGSTTASTAFTVER